MECGGIERILWLTGNVVAHQGMWWHRENMMAQKGYGGSEGMWWLIKECGGIERIWWLRGDVVAHQGMWWHRENMVAQSGCGGSSRNVVA
jgi:hypothetical protein